MKKEGDNWKEIVPIERTDCSILIHDGVTLCTEPGICKYFLEQIFTC